MKKLDNTLNKAYKLFLVYLYFILFFQLSRFVFLLYFGNGDSLSQAFSNIIPIVYNGFRFDTVVSLYGLIPMVLLVLISLFIPTKRTVGYSRFFIVSLKYYSIFVALVFLIIITLDFFYFKTYDHHFDALLFALKNDGTAAIFASLWSDYPLIKVLFFWLITFVVLRKTIQIPINKNKPFNLQSIGLGSVAMLLFLGVYFLGMRGSVGMFPLQRKHAFSTEHLFSNRITLNSVFALKSVLLGGDSASRINTDYKKSLKKSGFNSIEDALKIYLNNDSIEANSSLNRFVFTNTKKNKFLAENPPHVVFILMESFGLHFYSLHNEKRNTLGDLETQLEHCTVYKNFLSSGNVTTTTLENLLVGTAFSPLAQSIYKNTALSTSVVIPFKKSGYTSTFLYSGEYAWRNFGEYTTTQGFDKVYSQANFENEYINPSKNPWGVQDEYLYDRLFKLLQTSDKQQFVFALTISNHTPYVLPETFKPKPVFFNDSLLKKMRIDEDLTYKSLKAYQYAADQLGKFIKRIRESELGKNTIIAVTGDHNSHQGFRYQDQETFMAHAVPFLLYIPKAYKPILDESKFGSHKNIFPTLYNLALSETSYFNTGENLLDSLPTFSINDFSFAANEYGAVKKQHTKTFYKWNADKTSLIKSGTDKKLDSLDQKMNAYTAIMRYYIQKELKETHD